MTRRLALAVLAAGLALVVVLDLILLVLFQDEKRVILHALDQRLMAVGRTAARMGVTEQRHLIDLATDNALEDAYVLDGELRVVAGARTEAGTRVNLLRLDVARVTAGVASVAEGYVVDDVKIRSGVFPMGGGRALVLEAGGAYLAPVTRLGLTYGVAAALSLGVAALFATGLWLAVRALDRARLAHGRAERLATVGQMAAMVAHEVRNPLGILRGQVELLHERMPAEAAARERERIDDMLAEIDRLSRLTDDLLGFARDAPLDLAEVDLTMLVADTVDTLRQHPGAARIEAPAAPPVLVEADAARLRQALFNLILNAVQAGSETVTVTVAREADRARVVVADDGPGVPAELRATLFEPFVGARSGGSGLGLAIAQRVAERHGGTLALGDGGPGAVFTLSLPIRADG